MKYGEETLVSAGKEGGHEDLVGITVHKNGLVDVVIIHRVYKPKTKKIKSEVRYNPVAVSFEELLKALGWSGKGIYEDG